MPIEDTHEYKRGYYNAIKDVWILFMDINSNLDATSKNMNLAKERMQKLKDEFGK